MRKKIKRFAENAQRNNVIETGKPWFQQVKGNWADFFENQNDIVIELGCGRGEYTNGLAQEFPEKNFIGIDLKGDRIWAGSSQAEKLGLKNVAYLRTNIDFIMDFFKDNEVNEIWLTFPDPRPKKRDAKRRLTHPKYMNWYKRLLQDEGWFKFKTDNTDLFNYTLDLIALGEVNVKHLHMSYDLYQSVYHNEHYDIMTKYERIWTEKGEKIKYLKCIFAG